MVLGAERASPGFLDYFLSENIGSASWEPGWQGDLYGAAHARPRARSAVVARRGVAMVAAAVGWARSFRHPARRRLAPAVPRFVCAYLMLWTLAPMLFLHGLGQRPRDLRAAGMPAFALLLCEFWRPEATDVRAVRFGWPDVGLRHAVLVLFVGVLVSQSRHFDVELSHVHGADVWHARHDRRQAGLRWPAP